MSLPNNRSRTPGASLEAQYRCLHCTTPQWRVGGMASLGRHLARIHGIDVDGFPQVVHVDTAGYVVDWEGAPTYERVGRHKTRVAATVDGVDGWMRSSPMRIRLGDS